MVLADAERTETVIVRQNRLLDDVAEHASLRLESTVRRKGDIAKRVEADCELFCQSASSLSRGASWTARDITQDIRGQIDHGRTRRDTDQNKIGILFRLFHACLCDPCGP
jgi:hypothetical protein